MTLGCAAEREDFVISTRERVVQLWRWVVQLSEGMGRGSG